ncbi:MAG: hypothetical protein ACYDBV_01245 [Nitrospiria bacterium]
MLKKNLENKDLQGRESFRSLTIFPVVLLFLFLSIAGIIHVYAYNELWGDEGCSVGALFCHGQTQASIGFIPGNPLYFQNFLLCISIFPIPFVLFYFHPKRGPPLV